MQQTAVLAERGVSVVPEMLYNNYTCLVNSILKLGQPITHIALWDGNISIKLLKEIRY